jgi:hypothetical protein
MHVMMLKVLMKRVGCAPSIPEHRQGCTKWCIQQGVNERQNGKQYGISV